VYDSSPLAKLEDFKIKEISGLEILSFLLPCKKIKIKIKIPIH
jgi:hypothetical protein